MNKLGVFFVLASLVAACAGTESNDPTIPEEASDEQDLTEAPYFEVVKTDDAQGTRIVAHGMPAVAKIDSGLEIASMLLEWPSSVPGYSSYMMDQRTGMGSFTGGTTPLLSIDTKTSPPTVTVQQRFVDLANQRLKDNRWSRLVEHAATDNSVSAGYGWKITYEPNASSYPKLNVERNGEQVLRKGASYWKDQAFGPSGCSYVPELASAAVSTQHKALLVRVHYETTTPECAIIDKYFTEELP